MTSDNLQSFVNLPWATLITLVSGYIGYSIAYYGHREDNKPTDMFFMILVFGFIGSSTYNIIIKLDPENILYSIGATGGAFISAISISILWRKWFKKWFNQFILFAKISYKNNNKLAWNELSEITDYSISQITVYLKNDNILTCENTYQFQNMPNGSCVLGGQGDVLMYVTREKINGRWKDRKKEVSHPKWGDEITYIPSSEISRIDLRRKPIAKN